MDELIREYRKALQEVNKERFEAGEEDQKLLGSCVDSLKYSIEYMEKGKPPENRRAITRLSRLQREIPIDPKDHAFIRSAVLYKTAGDNLTAKQKETLQALLGLLTVKEREAFFMVRGNGYSFGETATLMGVAKGTVQNMVLRAEKKIAHVVRMPPNSRRRDKELKKAVQESMN